MSTLKNKRPDAYERLARQGFVGIAGLMDKVGTGADLDRLLGTNGSASNWMQDKYMPNMQVEYRAQRILEDMNAKANEMIEHSEPNADMFLLFVPSGKAEKVKRVLGMMDCVIEDL